MSGLSPRESRELPRFDAPHPVRRPFRPVLKYVVVHHDSESHLWAWSLAGFVGDSSECVSNHVCVGMFVALHIPRLSSRTGPVQPYATRLPGEQDLAFEEAAGARWESPASDFADAWGSTSGSSPVGRSGMTVRVGLAMVNARMREATSRCSTRSRLIVSASRPIVTGACHPEPRWFGTPFESRCVTEDLLLETGGGCRLRTYRAHGALVCRGMN